MLIGVDLVDDGLYGPPIAERILTELAPHACADLRLVVFCRPDSVLATPFVASPHIAVEVLTAHPGTAIERGLPGVYPIDLLFCPLGRIALNWPLVPVVTAFLAPSPFFSRFGLGAFDLATGDALYAAHRAAITLVTFERARDILLQTTRRPAATIINVAPLPPLPQDAGSGAAVVPTNDRDGSLVVVHCCDDAGAAIAVLDDCHAAFDAGAFGRLTIVTASPHIATLLDDRHADLAPMTSVVAMDDDIGAAFANAAIIVLDDLDGTNADMVRTILSHGRSTIVADRGGLVEWSAGAVLGYDPALPGALADAIVAVDRDGSAAALPRGVVNAGEATDYPAIFRRALLQPGFADYVSPVHTDGWVGESLVVACGPATSAQRLDIDLATDHGMPSPNVVLEVLTSAGDRIGRAQFPTGCPFRIACEMPAEGGAVHVRSLGLSLPAVTNPADHRRLGFRFDRVSVTADDQHRALAPAWPASGGYWLALVAGGDQNATFAIGSLASDMVPRLTIDLDDSTRADGSIWLRSPRGVLEFPLEGGAVGIDAIAGGDVLCWEAPDGGARTIDTLRLIEGETSAQVIRFDSTPIGPPAELVGGAPDNARFSVVIPSFNQGRYLEQAIRSALDQQHLADIHVVDAGSSDETASVLAGFGERITAIVEPDDGQADAVNKGIAHGNGEFIAWLNSDDAYLPGTFARVAAIFAQHPSIDVVYGEADHVDEHGRFLSRYPVEPFDAERLTEACFLCQPATFIRRRALGEHGMLRKDLHFCLDYELWLRLAAGGAVFERTYHKLAISRLHAETKTLAQRVAAHHETSEMFAQCFGRFSAKWAEAWAAMLTADRGLHHLDGRVRAIARAFWLRRARRFRTLLDQGATGPSEQTGGIIW